MIINSLLSHRSQEPENGVLYIVGTPIGNLNDISNRALNILKNVSLIACEDTRQTQKLMSKYDLKNNLISFNKNNSHKKIPVIINQLKQGKSIALVSDAGMPSICDPGEELIKDIRINKLDIISIPGPCAAIVAIVSSGYECSKFNFEGFLPRKKIEREKLLLEISQNKKTTILYESPHRLKKLLIELKEYCGGSRNIHVARELTKRFEQHLNSNIDKVIEYYEKNEVLGEYTIVIRGINQQEEKSFNSFALRKELKDLIEAGLTLSAASKYLAKKENLTKKTIYNLY